VLNYLFSSKTRVEILKLFLFNSENSFYQRQISLLTSQSIRGVQREVEKLQKIGLIEASIQGNRIYYRVNKECPILEELKRILLKSVGIAEVLKENLNRTPDIRVAFIFGSYARGEESLSSDIDLFIVGSITSKELSTVLSRPKKELGREINYVLYPLEEFKKKIRQNDHFLKTVLREKKIFIIGGDNELGTIGKSG
jgi:predicted nucleotidyltransferase